MTGKSEHLTQLVEGLIANVVRLLAGLYADVFDGVANASINVPDSNPFALQAVLDGDFDTLTAQYGLLFGEEFMDKVFASDAYLAGMLCNRRGRGSHVSGLIRAAADIERRFEGIEDERLEEYLAATGAPGVVSVLPLLRDWASETIAQQDDIAEHAAGFRLVAETEQYLKEQGG